jgi:lipid-binding SYLF domain-containing protein
MGLGLQVGLEVANYIFILQTKEALEHFQRGGSVTLGANVGAALAGIGREAVGAASVSGALCGIAPAALPIKEDEYTYEDGGLDDRPNYHKNKNHHHNHGSSPTGRSESSSSSSPSSMGGGSSHAVAPIVAYAKSEGLYLGVSLEGSKIFTREELNARAYKFSSHNHKPVTAQDVLTGKVVQRPVEAERLYAILHAIELTHEMSSLPSLPKCQFLLGGDDDWSNKPWDASSAPYSSRGGRKDDGHGGGGDDDDETGTDGSRDATDSGTAQTKDETEVFCERFQHFLHGGITVRRISTRKRENRTLWLYAPQTGSLRLGFVSKLFSATSRTTYLSTSIIQDVPKATSAGGGASTVSDTEGDEVTLDSALMVRAKLNVRQEPFVAGIQCPLLTLSYSSIFVVK